MSESAFLSALSKSVRKPNYDRAKLTAGIVHLGVGAFHRAHQAVYIDDYLSAGHLDWGIVGVSMRSATTRNALKEQGYLYSLAMCGNTHVLPRMIGSILDILVAPEDPGAVVAVLSRPEIRIVSLTVTEAGYLRRPDGSLDWLHPDLCSESSEIPKSIYGYLCAAIASRRRAGLDTFTLLSCDNLPENGSSLNSLLIEYATRKDPDLAVYIAKNISCPNSMVDRIVPATTDADRDAVASMIGTRDAWPVMTEPFSQWLVEDKFAAGRPAWEACGVQMVHDVEPYEHMKLRLLNGAHSAIAYSGLLLGRKTVAQSFADPDIRSLVHRLWAESSATILNYPELDPAQYTHCLSERFSNAGMRHLTAQIANDGSEKLPQRIIAPALALLEKGQKTTALITVVALWGTALLQRRAVFRDQIASTLRDEIEIATPELAAHLLLTALDAGKSAKTRSLLTKRLAVTLDSIRKTGVRTTLAALRDMEEST